MSSADPILAADWAGVKNSTIDMVVCSLVQQSAQSMTSGSNVIITFGASSEIVDSHGSHDTVTNNGRITPPRSGLYWVHGIINIASNTTCTSLHGLIRKSGSNYTSVRDKPNNGSNTCSVEVSGLIVIDAGAGDYLELVGVQTDSGASARNTNVTTGQSSVFEAFMIRPWP